MKLWKHWSRKIDGWVGRRRRFQKTDADRALELARKDVVSGAEAGASTAAPDSGKTR